MHQEAIKIIINKIKKEMPKKTVKDITIEDRRKTKYILLPREEYVKPVKKTVKTFKNTECVRLYDCFKTNAQKRRIKEIVFNSFFKRLVNDLIINQIEYEFTTNKMSETKIKLGYIEKFLGNMFFKEHLKNGDKSSKRYVVRIYTPKERAEVLYKQLVQYYKPELIREKKIKRWKLRRIKKYLNYKIVLNRTNKVKLLRHIKETGTIYDNKFMNYGQ